MPDLSFPQVLCVSFLEGQHLVPSIAWGFPSLHGRSRRDQLFKALLFHFCLDLQLLGIGGFYIHACAYTFVNYPFVLCLSNLLEMFVHMKN